VSSKDGFISHLTYLVQVPYLGKSQNTKNNQFRRNQHIVLWINNVLWHVWLLEASAETARHCSNTGLSPSPQGWQISVQSYPLVTRQRTLKPTCIQIAGIDVSLTVINWCINPIVLQVEWWFDGKHFSSLNHMKWNCTSYSSCLQLVSRAKRLVSDSCCVRRCLTQFNWRSR